MRSWRPSCRKRIISWATQRDSGVLGEQTTMRYLDETRAESISFVRDEEAGSSSSSRKMRLIFEGDPARTTWAGVLYVSRAWWSHLAHWRSGSTWR